MVVSWRKDGICGLVLLNNPPVNAINREIRQGLLEAVDWAETQGLERVILSGAGSCFAAGADAKEFDRAPEIPHLPDVLTVLSRARYLGLPHCMVRFLAAVQNWLWHAVAALPAVMYASGFQRSFWAWCQGLAAHKDCRVLLV